MTTPTAQLAGIALPPGMIWADEFDWTAPLRAVEYSLTGALVIDSARRSAGRPITLQGEADHGWMRRSALAQLWQLADAGAAAPMALVLADGRQYSVHFAAGEPLSAKPLARAEVAPAALPYIVTLRLIAA